jgi:hypothetical protein
MTTLVTRLYDDPAHADAAVATLKADGFPDSTMDIIEQRGRASARDRIEAAGVPVDIARQYAQHLTSNRALLVVRAPFVPFGAARRAIEVADQYPAINAGIADQNANLPDRPDPRLFLSILTSHRLFLTNLIDVRNDLKPRGFSRAFRIPLLSEKPKKRMRPAIIDQRFGNFLFPLLSGHGRMTKKPLIDGFFAGFILPHLSGHRRPRRLSHYRITN